MSEPRRRAGHVERVDWLVQEINDLLDVSSVGLYEFLDFLNDPELPLALDERHKIADLALNRILGAGGVELHWMRWPRGDNLGTAELPVDRWRGFDEGGRYLALERTGAPGPDGGPGR